MLNVTGVTQEMELVNLKFWLFEEWNNEKKASSLLNCNAQHNGCN